MGVDSSHIKVLILDVDGVLTDGGMYYGESGELLKRFHTRDGIAIRRLIKAQFPVGLVSAGLSNSEGIVRARAHVLGIELVYVGEDRKIDVLEHWLSDLGIKLDQVAYIGDDVNDLEVMQKVGLAACPADAVQSIKEASHVVLDTKGGHGCVREFADRFLTAPK